MGAIAKPATANRPRHGPVPALISETPITGRRRIRRLHQPKARVWPVAVVFGVAFIAVPLLVHVISPFAALTSVLLGLLVATALLLAWPAASSLGWRERLALGRSKLNFKVDAAMAVGFISDLVLSISLAMWMSAERPDLDPLLDAMSKSVLAGLIGAMARSLIPGICEEVLFRGFAQTRFVARWGEVRGIALASLFFAAMHGSVALVILPGGVWFGLVAWRTGSNWSSIPCTPRGTDCSGLRPCSSRICAPTRPRAPRSQQRVGPKRCPRSNWARALWWVCA